MTDKTREEIYEEGNYFAEIGFGDQPAVVVVDLAKTHTDPDQPRGADLSELVENCNGIVDAAHDNDVPVVWTRIVYKHPEASEGGGPRKLRMRLKKSPTHKDWVPGSELVELDDRCNINESDYILDKRHATVWNEAELDLDSLFRGLGIDTVIMTGCSTSGCIRASVDDSAMLGYHTIIPEECVGDRSEEQHESHLYAMGAKYADVLPMKEVKDYLNEV